MASTLVRKLRYVKDRSVNAYWMLRSGKFKLIFHSFYIEVEHRVQILLGWLSPAVELDDSQVPASAFVDKRKVLPASYRPTHSQPSRPEPLQADPTLVGAELGRILSVFHVEESVEKNVEENVEKNAQESDNS